MRTPTFTRQCERDLRLLQQRGKAIPKLRDVMTLLIEEQPFWQELFVAQPT